MRAPSAPDPMRTAAAQTRSNIDTATAQQVLNMTNQYTPYGSRVFDQIGTTVVNGQNVPRFNETVTLSPEQQRLYDDQLRFDTETNRIGLEQVGRVGELLSTPLDLSNPAVEGRIMELGRARLDPMMEERRRGAETTMRNQGLLPGSPAWEARMRSVGNQENDAYNDLLLDARRQAVGEIIQQRNQQINEPIALMNGQQLINPTFQSTPQTGVQGTNVAGLINQDYQNRLSSHNAMLGGLFGLGGAGLMALSDRRVKKDVRKVGKVGEHNLYTYRYKGDPSGQVHAGVMAQEVAGKQPDAVVKTARGLFAVDYGKIIEGAGK